MSTNLLPWRQKKSNKQHLTAIIASSITLVIVSCCNNYLRHCLLNTNYQLSKHILQLKKAKNLALIHAFHQTEKKWAIARRLDKQRQAAMHRNQYFSTYLLAIKASIPDSITLSLAQLSPKQALLNGSSKYMSAITEYKNRISKQLTHYRLSINQVTYQSHSIHFSLRATR